MASRPEAAVCCFRRTAITSFSNRERSASMALLEVVGLKKTYPTGETALRGIDLAVDGAEVIAVLGLSGSGKSTLLRCINRLVEPSEGLVVLDGVRVSELDRRGLQRARRHMGMIFQEYNLVDRLTVLENVLSGCLGVASTWRAVTRAFRKDDIERAMELCSRVGILDQIRKRADQLSGGQRQRVGIARALMQQPKILLVDEPTSSLDPKIGAEVMELMCAVADEHHVPMLVSVHDLDVATGYSKRIVGLREGRIVFDAETREVDRSILHSIYTDQDAA
ncbi:MAG TPA: phosphonate ABC transporter ATP-binding protein [Candidatus Latescibacteria bacterium]|nr:phosphonate ABC transporter ATP-binding protein [Candidatus Handelsmanbacteria bacterium]HIL11678.1 phosphonate ABC transporter ATP-binding protein [Candidatus Latescibacterota bacterium]